MRSSQKITISAYWMNSVRLRGAVEQQGNGVKDAAVQELETANLNLESMRAKISLKLNDHTDVIEELAEEKNIWLGIGNEDGVQAQAEEQIAAMREYILSFKNPNQAKIMDFNISSYLTRAVENVTRIYAAIPTSGNEEEYFSAEQNAQLIADTYAVRQILEWEMTWKRVYRDRASEELGFMETEDLIEKVKDIQNERGLLYRLLTGDIENYEPKKKQLHTLYRENTEALIYGIEDYIVEIPAPEVSANLDNKIDAMTGTVTRQKQNIGEVVNSPLVLTQNNAFSQKEVIDEGATGKQINTDEKDSNSGGLILAIAIMIDGLIVALCFIVGKSSINDQIENQRVLMRALLIPEQKKETETAQSMLIISVVLAGIVLIPLSFIPALAIGWLLLIGAILTGIFNVILTGTEMVSSRPWFRKLVNRYFVTKPDAVENISAGFSDTFIRLIKDITALDEADFDGAEKAFKQGGYGQGQYSEYKAGCGGGEDSGTELPCDG